jgi:CheY-like chemotaxis protein
LKPVKTLFLVDDDADEHDLFGEALKEVSADIELVTAINGLDAIDKLNSTSQLRPDVIFLDLNMPKMNGMQLLEKIKEHNELSAIPVHIYTTSSNPDDKAKALNMGAHSFFTKPDSFRELCSTISKITQ